MKVTVIIPTYQRLTYLAQALASVVQQTYDNWECIVVNDYYSDAIAVANLIQAINDSRILLINHQFSQGGNAARNTAIKQATGEIIAFLDDDDLWLANKLEKHVAQHQQNTQIGLVFSGVTQCWHNEILPTKTTLGSLPNLEVTQAMVQGIFCPHTTSAVTVLKQCFLDCGLFDENLVSFQDWDMWFRIAQVYDFACVNEALVIFQQHFGDRVSQSIQLRLQGLTQITTKWETQIIDLQKFRDTFTKEVYITYIQKLILQGKRQEALIYWQLLLKISRNTKDFLQLIKLALLFMFGVNSYGFLLQSLRFFKIRYKFL